MAKHTFVEHYKLHDVQGKIDYISNPDRQEHLFATYDTTIDERFWDYLAGENHRAFEASGATGECVEAREFVIMLPPSLREYDPQLLLKLFTDKFKAEYGLDCGSALHWNKAESNYHIHLIYSERRPLENPDIRIASRNMFYDENGKHRRTKKEILDEEGNLRPGCRIVRKGEEYKCRFFGPKEAFVGTSKFLSDVKHMYTDVINACVKDESERLTVFDRSGPYLATKKIGKNNPKEDVIRADNEARMEWNRTVDEARVAGIPEEDIVALKKDFISSEVKKSIKDNGNKPERLGEIIRKAIGSLVEKIRNFKFPEKPAPLFDFAAYNEMVKVNNALRKVIAEIAAIDKKIKHKQNKISESPGFRYRSFRITLNKEIAELLILRKEKQDELDRIVKKAGYKDVNKFMIAFEKSCRLLEKYQAEHPDEQQPVEKESVLSKLKSYQAEAKTTVRKDPGKQKKKETER
ncbi:MAG: MobA/MobL family protein [Lachnospiraceae bacterium]|nr:MobA/MobL family protein [Lachnospiraceae bacterium]